MNNSETVAQGSFECTVEASTTQGPLFEAVGKEFRSFEAAFHSSVGEPVNVVVYSNEDGLLAGIDIHLGPSNHCAMPDKLMLQLIYSIPEVEISDLSFKRTPDGAALSQALDHSTIVTQ